ncbi:alpha/beta hydrolase-fold protein [Algoriphagus sediminis]|uniref:Alpha/beta hydrolase-fold protein n=1 Tax=Algoriphagus sediminis TaxID=3057113 RepID=A0ABT7YET2_9BACT|nr:alpha/beta hydrolase-fold protein [Algoriphagus sediminis]MDN3205040.1 alpha/beta hydrolase-fold protein [Algoriphagus sediminis]
MKYSRLLIILLLFALSCEIKIDKPGFRILIIEELADDVQDGRLLVILSKNPDSEPRFGISDNAGTNQVFGMDFDSYDSGKELVLDPESFGYPVENIGDLPEGEYYVQAFIQKYETFERGDGHTVKLPMDQGEGRKWNRAPGNIYSLPKKVDLKSGFSTALVIDQIISKIEEPEDTEYIKHIKMKSDLLSEFWGRDMYLGAHVLLPEGFDENPNAHYPLMIFHGHFPADFGGFRTTPPDPDLPEDDYSARFDIYGYEKIVQQEAYDFYKKWTSDDFKRFIIIQIQHQNPYYDDSYAVNSENLGPYGDAITYELVPHIEEKFRGIGEGWSRFLYGGSTGGWEALAAQVKYPDEYNGCFAACPDPIDFRAYMLVNIYEDENAYYVEGDFKKTLRPGHRDYLGNVDATLKDMNHRELALGGDKSRSGDQMDIWQAVYSPVGEDGYPKPIWDRYTGEIDHEVAEYWKENYDLRYIMERDWETLGPKLEGKVHIYCGDMDNYYLNNAVYLAEDFLEKTQNPYYGGTVAYGDRAEHCWNGDPNLPNYLTRLRYNTMYLDEIEDRLRESAPENFNQENWTLLKN